MPPTHSLQVTVQNISVHLHFDGDPWHKVKCGISHGGVKATLKKFRILDFQIRIPISSYNLLSANFALGTVPNALPPPSTL
jgi:hypothetical protein